MTASLVSAKAQVDNPDVSVAGAELHSRVHVSDSCNCFKFFVPSCLRKEKKHDRTETRVAATAHRSFAARGSEHLDNHHALYRDTSPDRIVRSPASDDLGSTVSQTQSVTVNVNCGHSPVPTPVEVAPIVEGIQPDDDSSETSVKGM